MRMLATRPELCGQLGREGRRTAELRFSAARFERDLLRLYDSVSAGSADEARKKEAVWLSPPKKGPLAAG
jgi:hypothetical protein